MTYIRQLALAIFETISEETKIQQLISQLEDLDFQLKTKKEYRLFLFDPQQSLSEKQKLIKQIFKNKIPKHTLNLISLLIQKNILINLSLLIRHLKKIRNQKFNLAEARVISALPLTKEEQEEIQKLVSKKNNKKIVLKPEIKPEILAGLIIQIEDNLIDLSLKTQLEKLKEILIQ